MRPPSFASSTKKRSPFRLNVTQWVVVALACAGQLYQAASASATPERLEKQKLLTLTTSLNGHKKTVYRGALDVLVKPGKLEIDRITYSESVFDPGTREWKDYWTSLELAPGSSQGPVPAVDFYGKPLVELGTYQMSATEGGLLILYLTRSLHLSEVYTLRLKIRPVPEERRFVVEIDEEIDRDRAHQIHLSVESSPIGITNVRIIQKQNAGHGLRRKRPRFNVLHSFDPAQKLKPRY